MKPLTLPQQYPSEYIIWMGMVSRCRNKNNKNYGGRGIRVCERWIASFENFITDMKPRPSHRHQLDRKNNDGNYAPDNCVWSTRSENARNRRTSRKITFKLETLTIAEWSERTGLSAATITNRLDLLGWSIEDALTKPKQPFGRKGRTIDFNGQRLSLTEWSEELGFNPVRLRKRLERGWSVEKSLTEPDHINQYNKTPIEFDGETQTIAEWSRRTGIERATIDYRLKNGWSIEEALATNTRKRIGKIEFNGETLTIAEWSRKLGIEAGVLYHRLAHGMPASEALTRPKRKHSSDLVHFHSKV